MCGDKNFNGWKDFVEVSNKNSNLKAENEKLKEESQRWKNACKNQSNENTRLQNKVSKNIELKEVAEKELTIIRNNFQIALGGLYDITGFHCTCSPDFECQTCRAKTALNEVVGDEDK